MADQKNKKYVPLKNFTTPIGITLFPAVNTPDTFMNKTQYKCDLLFDNDNPEFIAFQAPIEAAAETVLAEAQVAYTADLAKAKTPAQKREVERNEPYLHVPWTDHTDKDGELTGQQRLKLTAGEDHKPGIFVEGCKGPQDVEIKGGLSIKVIGQMVPFSMNGRSGIALSRMSGVKVYGGGGGSGGAMDFGEGVEDSSAPAGQAEESQLETAGVSSSDGDY